MSTSYYPPAPTPYAPYRQTAAASNPVAFKAGTDPKQAAANERQRIAQQGDYLQAQAGDLSNQYAEQASGVENYLNPIENTLAQGGGGYNPTESAAINYSPEEQQRLVTGAGISAGAGTASAVGAADRAAAAAGGNPAALAAYRARAAQTQGAASGDAMTQARLGAKQAASTGAQATGGARLAQQGQALGYYGGLQQEKNANALNEQGIQSGLYATETSGGNAATGNTINAAMVPTGLDKTMGFVSGLVSGASGGHKADGDPGYLEDGGTDAVVAEAGPEAIIENKPRYMAEGDTAPGGTQPNWLQRYLANANKQPNQTAPQSQAWNKTTPYSQTGSAIGGLFRPNDRDGQSPGGRRLSSQVFSPGSSQMPMAGGDPATDPDRIPGGLVNRTGSTIDGIPSLGTSPSASSSVDASAGSADGIDELEGAGEAMAADGAMTPRYRVRPRTTLGIHTPEPGTTTTISSHTGSAGAREGMANGGPVPQSPAFGLPPNTGPIPQRPPIITRPTRVHLDPGDQVVPLSYRPKAKIRPSAALAAMAGGSRA